MEENKYYTPSIEEFCVGFEFEYLNHFGKNFGKWTIESVDANDSFFHIGSLLASRAVRVKYLDSQDIESLGLIPIPNFPERTKDIYALTFTNPAKSFILEYYPNIETIREVMRTKLMIRAAENHLLFSGFCRNKSELIRILKMLRKYE